MTTTDPVTKLSAKKRILLGVFGVAAALAIICGAAYAFSFATEKKTSPATESKIPSGESESESDAPGDHDDGRLHSSKNVESPSVLLLLLPQMADDQNNLSEATASSADTPALVPSEQDQLVQESKIVPEQKNTTGSSGDSITAGKSGKKSLSSSLTSKKSKGAVGSDNASVKNKKHRRFDLHNHSGFLRML